MEMEELEGGVTTVSSAVTSVHPSDTGITAPVGEETHLSNNVIAASGTECLHDTSEELAHATNGAVDKKDVMVPVTASEQEVIGLLLQAQAQAVSSAGI